MDFWVDISHFCSATVVLFHEFGNGGGETSNIGVGVGGELRKEIGKESFFVGAFGFRYLHVVVGFE